MQSALRTVAPPKPLISTVIPLPELLQTPSQCNAAQAIRNIDDQYYFVSHSKFYDYINSVDRHGKSALHYAARNGLDNVAAKLLEYQELDINARSQSGNTAMHYAVYNNHTDIVRLLLQHPKIDLYIRNNYGSSAYLLLDTSNNPIFNRLTKHRLIHNEKSPSYARLLSVSAQKPLEIPTLLAEVTYVDGKTDPVDIAEFYLHYYEIPELRPIMKIAALAALGKHRRGIYATSALGKDKHLKIFTSDTENITSIHHAADLQYSDGLYNHKHSLFASSQNAEKLAVIIIHEMAHFVMNELYENGSNPYQAGDKTALDATEAITRSLYAQPLPATLVNIFRSYDECQWHSELVAHLYEFIAEKQTAAPLRTLSPESYAFLLQLNTACEEYLKTHQAEKYLKPEIDWNVSHLSSPLTTSSELSYGSDESEAGEPVRKKARLEAEPEITPVQLSAPLAQPTRIPVGVFTQVLVSKTVSPSPAPPSRGW